MAIKKLQGERERQEGIYYEFDTQGTLLGEGSTGYVFHGKKVTEATGETHDVAIKFLYNDLSEESIERARREANIHLRNDNLIEMLGFFEIDEDDNGIPVKRYHVVSELLTGVMLSDLMHGKTTDSDGHEIPFARELYNEYLDNPYRFTVFVIQNVLAGLMALHDAGYLHRDIDPDNIMITTDRHVKLIDFGIAKKFKNLADEKALTAVGQFVGNASYAAPELVLGDIEHQNATVDIYATGILLYQCLIGHLPFEGTTREVLPMQLHAKMPINAVKQTAMRKVILKATAKDQRKRYQTASEFRVALDRIANRAYPERFMALKKVGAVLLLLLALALVAWGVRWLVNAVRHGEAAAPVPTLYDHLKDPAEAQKHFGELEKMSEKGDANATYLLSRLYFVSGVSHDYRPDSVRQMQLALELKPDTRKAHELLVETIKQNPKDYHALYELGCDFLGGPQRTNGVIARDIEKADEYYQQALKYAEEAGDEEYQKMINDQIRKYQ